ncbi:TetR family transcriptional regulator [Streptomyces sp. ICBB 8177]|nr:TetR family transcriptional regulator [Streptomyces sp. ICBB 8177]
MLAHECWPTVVDVKTTNEDQPLAGGRDAEGARRSDRTRAAILRAARERFAEHGFERTTIRAVAADADIDPSMVMRYFGTKERLFDAALDIDLRLPDLAGVPLAGLPELLVRHFLDRWESDPPDDGLLVLLRSAVTNERAARRTREMFAAQVAPAVAGVLPPRSAARVGLVSAQLLGLALTRYLLRMPAVTELSKEEIVETLAPAIARTLGL